MKITNGPISQSAAHGIEQTRAAEAKTKIEQSAKKSVTSEAGAHSNVELSENAQLMNHALHTARNAPDVNGTRVAELKKAILEGSYQVSSEDIADKLLEQHLNIHFGKNTL